MGDLLGTDKIVKSDAAWKADLTPAQFAIARQHGTERAFTGQNWDQKAAGTYSCVCCGQLLFESTTKYDSGTGWPSFTQPVDPTSVDEHTDHGLGMARTEVRCSRCDAHLGHVFSDGPRPTGLRYCMNGNVLTFTRTQPGE